MPERLERIALCKPCGGPRLTRTGETLTELLPSPSVPQEPQLSEASSHLFLTTCSQPFYSCATPTSSEFCKRDVNATA